MVLWLLRGVSKITAAATGLTLVYGVTYAMDGMTKRIPTTPLHELITSTLWALPWTLLFCSGIEDLGKVTQKALLFWVWATTGLGFLYCLEHFTGDSMTTKAAMPLLTLAGGSLPHLVRRMSFVFTIASLAAGVAGFAVIYSVLARFISGSALSFATATIGFPVSAFAITSTTAALSIPSIGRRRSGTT